MNRFLLILLVIGAIYVLGPSTSTPIFSEKLPPILDTGAELSNYIAQNEARLKVKPNNEARIVWNDPIAKNKTKYAVVYLHGFTGSQEEGNPVHTNFAKSIGANLYLSRLSEHGLESDNALLNMTADNMWESAKEAYAIGKKLGEQVILMGTSNGGTMALMLAAEQYPEIAGLILLSPNIRINNPSAILLDKPWGLFIARAVKQSNFNTWPEATPIQQQYWTTRYRLEALVQVQKTLDEKMVSDVFKKVTQPTLMLYYYKDEINQDKTVKVSAMLQMFEQISTISALKKSVSIPNAGDHVIGSYITSKDIPEVEKQINLFANQLKWNTYKDTTTYFNDSIKISSDTSLKSNQKLKKDEQKKEREWVINLQIPYFKSVVFLLNNGFVDWIKA
jgi:esterase/lipase